MAITFAMKHTAHIYAKAFVEALGEHPSPEKERARIKNFIALLVKNGDIGHARKILESAKKVIREKKGRRSVVIETARPLPTHGLAEEITKPSDVVEEKIDPELIAGVRITINDELQFDGTLKRKINELFSQN